ncbi:hypothetical protein [Dehalococcoides mccartyi]|uniref:hypothetical protein n=1 Tax=Dehalococcoides mccartyi TaxID=61435 RepID=UPI0008058F4A|nr:hypothetical protein [Dehalococcoides mccartyi]OBW61981.1 MAG: hypothetical protein A9181_03160 [Dehalococcoides mccartyi]
MKIIYQEIKHVSDYADIEWGKIQHIILSIYKAVEENLSYTHNKLIPAVILITIKNEETDEFLVSRYLFYGKDQAELIRLGIGLFDQTLLNTDFIPDYKPVSVASNLESLEKELING